MACNSLWAFNAAASFVLCLHMMVVLYTVGVIRPLEKRFGLNALQTALIQAIADLSHTILVIFAGYFSRRAHKPRIMGIATLFIAVGGALAALPYFLFPVSTEQALTTANQTLIENPNFQVCSAEPEMGNATAGQCARRAAADNSQTAYIMIMIGQIFQGIASAPISSLGIAYLHENTDKNNAYLQIGVLTSMYAWGPIIGLGLSSVALLIPENPIEAQLLTPNDPRWVGAWWIGFVVVGALALVGSLPLLFCFPKRMPDSPHPIVVEGEDLTKSEPILKQLKEFPGNCCRMFKNGAFTALQFSFVSGTYVVFGVFLQLPRYLEIQFHQPLWLANIIAAISSAVAGAVGNVLCGVLMKKFKVTPQGAAKFIMGVILIATVGDVVLMFFACPKSAYGGQLEPNAKIEPNTTCSFACHCDREKYEPICGADLVTYYSPCHAGCPISGVTYEKGKPSAYSNCTCLAAGESTADPGLCSANNKCYQFIAYAGVLFAISFVVNMARVPATVLQIRLIGGDSGSFVIAMQSFLTNLLGLIPAPILFAVVIDSLCLLWGERCGRHTSCLVYDTETYRWEVHGISGAFLFGAFFLTAVCYCLIRNRAFDDETEAKPINEKQPGEFTNGKQNPAFNQDFDDIDKKAM